MRRIFSVIVIILIAVSQTGCVLLVQVFVRNFSDLPIVLKLPRQSSSNPGGMEFLYQNSLVKINMNTMKQLNMRLVPDLRPGEITLIIPPKSTVNLNPYIRDESVQMDMNPGNLKLGKAKVILGDIVVDSLDIDKFPSERKFKRRSGPLIRNLFYYDFKLVTP